MRTPTLGSAYYFPGIPPTDLNQLHQFLIEELQKLSAAITALSLGHLDKTTVTPPKPREGDIRFADGALWNPGAGQGIYAYYAASWHLLG